MGLIINNKYNRISEYYVQDGMLHLIYLTYINKNSRELEKVYGSQVYDFLNSASEYINNELKSINLVLESNNIDTEEKLNDYFIKDSFFKNNCDKIKLMQDELVLHIEAYFKSNSSIKPELKFLDDWNKLGMKEEWFEECMYPISENQISIDDFEESLLSLDYVYSLFKEKISGFEDA